MANFQSAIDRAKNLKGAELQAKKSTQLSREAQLASVLKKTTPEYRFYHDFMSALGAPEVKQSLSQMLAGLKEDPASAPGFKHGHTPVYQIWQDMPDCRELYRELAEDGYSRVTVNYRGVPVIDIFYRSDIWIGEGENAQLQQWAHVALYYNGRSWLPKGGTSWKEESFNILMLMTAAGMPLSLANNTWRLRGQIPPEIFFAHKSTRDLVYKIFSYEDHLEAVVFPGFDSLATHPDWAMPTSESALIKGKKKSYKTLTTSSAPEQQSPLSAEEANYKAMEEVTASISPGKAAKKAAKMAEKAANLQSELA